jgi:hypothetical protein
VWLEYPSLVYLQETHNKITIAEPWWIMSPGLACDTCVPTARSKDPLKVRESVNGKDSRHLSRFRVGFNRFTSAGVRFGMSFLSKEGSWGQVSARGGVQLIAQPQPWRGSAEIHRIFTNEHPNEASREDGRPRTSHNLVKGRIYTTRAGWRATLVGPLARICIATNWVVMTQASVLPYN